MSKHKKPLPQKPVPVAEDWEQFLTWARKHGGTAVTILLAALVVGVALWSLLSRQERRAEQAAQALAAARSSADFETIVAEYPKADAAPIALLSLAKIQFDMGNYEAAMMRYQDFLASWPEHPLQNSAVLGRLFCLEAQGHQGALQEAEAGFSQFARNHPEHYLFPQARLGEARCKQALGQLEEARALYESFLADHPQNPWSLQIAERLSALEREIKRQQS